MNWILYVYELLLLVYTGFRTYDLMIRQLPSGMDPTGRMVIGLAFLGATEAGLIIWHFLHRKAANTTTQERTAHAMTWIDFTASMGAGVGDMVLTQTILAGYVMPPLLGYILMYGLPLVFAANVGAGIFYSTHDAGEMEARKQKQIAFAKTDTQLEILDQTIQSLRAQKQAIANSIKKDTAKVLRDEVLGAVSSEFGLDGHSKRRIEWDETPASKSLLERLGARFGGNGNGNGNGQYNSETAELEYTPAKQERKERPGR